MKNKLKDLNDALFQELEALQDDEAMADEKTFDRTVRRAKAVVSVASQIIQNDRLILDAYKVAGEYQSPQPLKLLVGEKNVD